MAKKITVDPRNKSLVPMKCRECPEIVPKVDSKAESVLCWRCTMKLAGGITISGEPQPEEKIS